MENEATNLGVRTHEQALINVFWEEMERGKGGRSDVILSWLKLFKVAEIRIAINKKPVLYSRTVVFH